MKRGEKAITLCMPVMTKRKRKEPEPADASQLQDRKSKESDDYFTMFVYRPHRVVLVQTEGEPLQLPELSQWNKDLALASLNIAEIPFECPDGNTLGYARRRELAVSPLSPFPYKTLFHEVGHVELWHTSEAEFRDGEHTPRNVREVEEESVALMCSESLGMDGAEYARGYLQHWLHGECIPEKSAQKIFSATDRILKAGERKYNS